MILLGLGPYSRRFKIKFKDTKKEHVKEEEESGNRGIINNNSVYFMIIKNRFELHLGAAAA